ncbi:hypothetical protein PV396_04190 [Streptomyces sp. ME02-8801-2C]|uniref:hypothetical protein n=1 Tax=Streptomyces sp. ME02-8801-2C TaxID=3028680 RepID=UPI0029BBF626|nr:hypothetical protein [Streptomyces sp. ME02-8801-2C]MDX3451155.1 hypothetical protein [Streptomyces sp. ME02-8801-2C]
MSDPARVASAASWQAAAATALVDSGIGLELGHQVEAHRVVLQLAAGAPAHAEVAPLPGVIGVSLVQPRCEGAAYGGVKERGARDQPQVPKRVVAAQEQRGRRGQGRR